MTAGATLSFAATPPLTWLWSNPLPAGNNIYDLASMDGLTVWVGDRGQVYTSLNDELWVPRELGTAKAARAVAFLGSQTLVTGEAGLAAYAESATLRNSASAPLTTLDLGTPDWIEAVATSASRAVAVGDNGAVYTTADGVNWTRQPQPFSTWLRGVAFGNNMFVTVGDGGFLATSPDGVAWQKRSSGTTVDLNRVAWLGDRFIAVGNSGRILSSSNGTSWSTITGANATGDLFTVAGTGTMYLVGGEGELRMRRSTGWWNQLSPSGTFFPAPLWTYYAACYNGASFLIGGPTGMLVGGFYTNTVGTVWMPLSESLRPWLWDVARTPDGGYVAVGDYGSLLTSQSGTRWQSELPPEAATNSVLLGVASGPGRIVAVGTGGTILTSTSGIVWGAVSPKPTEADLQGVVAWSGGFVVTGGAGTILTSATGLDWTVRSVPVPRFLSGVAAHPGGLIAVGDQGAVFTSPDAVSWKQVNLATTNWLYRVRHLAGRLVIVGEAGALFTSADASHWSRPTSGTTNWLNDAAWFAGQYYAVGTQGTVISSGDLANWHGEACVTQKSLYGLVSGEHQMVAVGIEGLILRAQPGAVVIPQYQRNDGTNLFRLTTLPGRRVRLERSASLDGFSELANLQSLDNTGEIIHQSATDNPAGREFFRAGVTD